MSDIAVRLILVVAVIAAAAAGGLLARRTSSGHPPVHIDGAGFSSGLVVFTSTECSKCKDVIAAAKATGAPLREVTYELEPGLQERVGVVGVPLTLVIDNTGLLSRQFAGSVGEQKLRRALDRAGV
jgi:hypothetical protein